MFKRATLEQTMREELYRAQLALLKSQTMQEFANADVAYNTARVKRLEKQLNEKKD